MTPEAYTARMQAQQKFLLDLARRINEGRPLQEREKKLIASLLRDVAEKMPLVQKKPRGQPPKFDASGARLFYDMRRSRGDTDAQAVAWLAEEANVTIEAIKKAIGQTRAQRDALHPAGMSRFHPKKKLIPGK